MYKFDLQRIKKDTKLTQREIADIIGVEQGYVSRIIKGQYALSDERMRILCNALDINQSDYTIADADNSTGIMDKRGIIRYWTDVDATGSGVFQFDDCDTDRFIDLQIPGFEDCKDAINLYGDSMSPRYKSGQIILLKKWTENFIEYGNVYLVITKNGHRMVKMLRAIKDEPQMVLCVSENLAFDPFPINKEDIHSLFLVKGSIDKSTL